MGGVFLTLTIFLISYSDIFKVWETNSDIKITFHPSIIFGFDFINLIRDSDYNKLTKNELRLHSETDKKRHTPTPIRLRVWPISATRPI